MSLYNVRRLSELVGFACIAYLAVVGAVRILGDAAPSWAASLAGNTVPQLISYQGTLRDADGEPADGTYAMTVEICDKAALGTCPIKQSYAAVEVRDGRFSVLINIEDTVQTNWRRSPENYQYVVLTVNGAQVTPAQRLATVPYALIATTLEEDATVDGLVTDGPIVLKDQDLRLREDGAHGIKWSREVDGPEFRGWYGFRWVRTDGNSELMRLTPNGLLNVPGLTLAKQAQLLLPNSNGDTYNGLATGGTSQDRLMFRGQNGFDWVRSGDGKKVMSLDAQNLTLTLGDGVQLKGVGRTIDPTKPLDSHNGEVKKPLIPVSEGICFLTEVHVSNLDEVGNGEAGGCWIDQKGGSWQLTSYLSQKHDNALARCNAACIYLGSR